MDDFTRVIDYVIDQAERYDIKNLEFEQDIIFKINRMYAKLEQEIMAITSVYGDIPTVLKMQQLSNKIEEAIRRFYNEAAMLLGDATLDYQAKSFTQMDDLMEVGLEVERKNRSVKALEMKKQRVFDEESIEFLRDHAMEQVRWMSNDLMAKTRSMLGELVIQGKGNKPAVRERLYKQLNITKSKAEEIAQTELSMAYNNGALRRIESFNMTASGQVMQKYWHGFKYSETTCTYCRPRIGAVYNYDDTTEKLPAHPRCRCVWLPFMQGWDKPISKMFYSRANMLNRVYTPDDIYSRINMRLGIDYGSYIPIDKATKYIEGERTNDVMKAIQDARSSAIDGTRAMFDVALEDNKNRMGIEFNTQMNFWKGFVSQNIVDKNIDMLSKSYEAVKGLMILPWSGEQLDKWNSLLLTIKKRI